MPLLTLNGIQLSVAQRGDLRRGQGDALPVLLLHGFTGSGESWEPFMASLDRGLHVITSWELSSDPLVWARRAEWERREAQGFSSLAVDMLGHGRSDAPDDPRRYSMEHTVDDLRAVLDALDVPRVHLLGYSMGGRVALAFTLAHPSRVATLVLESASPGLAMPADRAARVASDTGLAERIERDGVPAFVDDWEALPLFATQARLPEDRRRVLHDQRLRNSPRGLANSLRGLGTGVQPSLWNRLHELATPTLLLTGASDTKFTEIARQMAGVMPCAELHVIADAGHTVHLEQPTRFGAWVIGWFAGIRRLSSTEPCSEEKPQVARHHEYSSYVGT